MEHKSKADQPTKYQTSLAIINWHGYPAIGLTTSSATKLMGTSCVTPLAQVQSGHTRHLANRNRAITIE